MKTVGNGRKRYYNIGKTKAVGSEYFYILAIKEYKKIVENGCETN
jgi:hypothetical protein